MEVLVCRNCDRRFNVLQLREEKRCPYCLSKNIGTFDSLLDTDKKHIRIQAMKDQLKKMGEMLKEDDDASLELQGKNKYGCEFYTPDSDEIFQEHPMCRCYQMPVLPDWNLQLSADDIDTQRFTTCTIDAEPGEITTEAVNKMSEIFVDTFKPRLLSDEEILS